MKSFSLINFARVSPYTGGSSISSPDNSPVTSFSHAAVTSSRNVLDLRCKGPCKASRIHLHGSAVYEDCPDTHGSSGLLVHHLNGHAFDEAVAAEKDPVFMIQQGNAAGRVAGDGKYFQMAVPEIKRETVGNTMNLITSFCKLCFNDGDFLFRETVLFRARKPLASSLAPSCM